MIKVLDRMDKHQSERDILHAAIWYHDSVYHPHRLDSSNVSDSSSLFKLTHPDWKSSTQKRLVVEMIEATSGHDLDSQQCEGPALVGLFLDMDLEVLSWDAARYRIYVSQIREEFSFVPDEQFRIGRVSVLNSLLAKPLFRTPEFAHLETKARCNVEREIDLLLSMMS